MENTMVNISVVANGAWGIKSMSLQVEYKGDPEKFREDVVMEAVVRGYTAILGYKDDWEMIMSTTKYPQLFETLLQKELRLQQEVEPRLKALRDIRDAYPYRDETMEIAQRRVVEKYAEEGITLTYSHDCWWANDWNLDGANFERSEIRGYLNTTRDVLRMMGLDPEGEAKKKQICTNLGLYRVA